MASEHLITCDRCKRMLDCSYFIVDNKICDDCVAGEYRTDEIALFKHEFKKRYQDYSSLELWALLSRNKNVDNK